MKFSGPPAGGKAGPGGPVGTPALRPEIKMAKDAGMDGLDALMAELAAKPQVYFVPIKGVPVGFDESVR